MHQCLAQYDGQIPEGFFVSEQILIGEYERHTRELKKVRNYIRAKKKKNLFETKFMEHYSGYLTQAEEVEERLKEQAAHREESEWQQMYGTVPWRLQSAQHPVPERRDLDHQSRAASCRCSGERPGRILCERS